MSKSCPHGSWMAHEVKAKTSKVESSSPIVRFACCYKVSFLSLVTFLKTVSGKNLKIIDFFVNRKEVRGKTAIQI